jgi:hypothetical protein
MAGFHCLTGEPSRAAPVVLSPVCSPPAKSVLAGHRRYAHITALRCDPVNPPLLGMRKVLSEDAVRRNLGNRDIEALRTWEGALALLDNLPFEKRVRGLPEPVAAQLQLGIDLLNEAGSRAAFDRFCVDLRTAYEQYDCQSLASVRDQLLDFIYPKTLDLRRLYREIAVLPVWQDARQSIDQLTSERCTEHIPAREANQFRIAIDSLEENGSRARYEEVCTDLQRAHEQYDTRSLAHLRDQLLNFVNRKNVYFARIHRELEALRVWEDARQVIDRLPCESRPLNIPDDDANRLRTAIGDLEETPSRVSYNRICDDLRRAYEQYNGESLNELLMRLESFIEPREIGERIKRQTLESRRELVFGPQATLRGTRLGNILGALDNYPFVRYAMEGRLEYADDGGLMAYGACVPDNFRRTAGYVDRILSESRRLAHSGAGEIRLCHQPQDREGARPYDPAIDPRPWPTR